ncbi:MAG: MATE family efflux transporter [Pseudomonadota bacterium]
MPRPSLVNGPVWKALIYLSAPMTLGIFAVLSVGIADAYFLGQVSEEALAAVGFIYPVTTALTSLSIGLSAGANAAISQAIGRDDGEARIARMSLHGLGLGLALSASVALVFYLVHPWLFGLMGARDAVLTEIKAYVPYWTLSFPLLVGLMVTNALFRAHGSAALASLFMILGAVINLGLNPLLIFGYGTIPALGTEGAALATLIGRGIAVIAAVGFAVRAGYLKRCGALSKDLAHSIKRVTEVGAPAAFSNAVNPAGMALVTAAVSRLGDAAIAGFGAATRVQSIALVVLFALSSGIGPLVGQNWGAGEKDRARVAVLQSWLFCAIYGLALGAVLFIFADPIAKTIATQSDAAAYTAQYFRVVGWSIFGYGIVVTANAAMNARSKALHSMSVSIGRTFAIYLPCAWIGVIMFGFTGILGAAVLANVLGAVLAIIACRQTGLTPRIRRATGLVWS